MVSAHGAWAEHRLLWFVVITSAENRGWPGDLAVQGLASAGLPVPSLVRMAKIATIEAAAATRLGRISPALLRRVNAELAKALNLDRRRLQDCPQPRDV